MEIVAFLLAYIVFAWVMGYLLDNLLERMIGDKQNTSAPKARANVTPTAFKSAANANVVQFVRKTSESRHGVPTRRTESNQH
jgi:SNF family Na+-dependent transporter